MKVTWSNIKDGFQRIEKIEFCCSTTARQALGGELRISPLHVYLHKDDILSFCINCGARIKIINPVSPMKSTEGALYGHPSDN